jgi:hypothetical protein
MLKAKRLMLIAFLLFAFALPTPRLRQAGF